MNGRRIALLLALAGASGAAHAAAIVIQPQAMRPVARIDPRFQSYNVEMAEVIGARFWAPYLPGGAVPADRYQLRAPADLANVRLRNLAKALGPAYMRVSGTWANSTYFQDDGLAAKPPPAGYKGVLTRAQWAGVVGFAKAVDARVVTSFAVGEGVRDRSGAWLPDQARRFLRYDARLGGSIAAIEPLNEPTFGVHADLPKDYSPERFAADNQAFRDLIAAEIPSAKIVGPSATGDVPNFVGDTPLRTLPASGLLEAAPKARFEIFSYHFYSSASRRCAPVERAATPAVALSEEWLNLTDRAHVAYATLRDRFVPGAPIWVTEIGQAACGGDPWAATFVDTFRYVDSLGSLARRGVAAVFHNTLTASDYALIDGKSGQPRPSYWAAVLWRRLMGETVLDAGSSQPGLRIYAHCLRGRAGGVGLIAINLDRSASATLLLPTSAERYTLSNDQLETASVKLNGRVLTMNGDRLPALVPVLARAGTAELRPATISFFAIPAAGNRACR